NDASRLSGGRRLLRGDEPSCRRSHLDSPSVCEVFEDLRDDDLRVLPTSGHESITGHGQTLFHEQGLEGFPVLEFLEPRSDDSDLFLLKAYRPFPIDLGHLILLPRRRLTDRR